MRNGVRATVGAALVVLSIFACSRQVPMADGPAGIVGTRSARERETKPAVGKEQLERFGRGSRQLAFELYRQLATGDSNVFVSPYSVRIALAMLYAGAEGDTEREMASALRWPLPEPALHAAFNATDLELASRQNEPYETPRADAPSRAGFELRLASAAFIRKDTALGGSFLDVLARHYGAGMFSADFATQAERERLAINAWVEDRTASRIKDLLPPNSLGPLTTLVLVNAIYFKASWLRRFPPELTEDGIFHGAAGDVTVPLMLNVIEPYVRGDGSQATELEYVSRAVRMLLVLPDEGRFAEVEAALDQELFDHIRGTFERDEVVLKLPKLRFESSHPLKPALQTLGMRQAFEQDVANFSGITSTPLHVDAVYHKTFIAIDEQGTEAAASTGVVTQLTSSPPPVNFVLDRPFLFVIYDDPTGEILFVGRLMQPE